MSEDESSSIDSKAMEMITKNFVDTMFQSINPTSNNQINNNPKPPQTNSNTNYVKKNIKKINHKQNKIINPSASHKKIISQKKISKNKYYRNNPSKNILSISTAYTHKKVNSLKYNDTSYNNYLNNYTTTNNVTLHKAIIEDKKEKKLFQDQLQFLKNHINKLKQEEDDLNKKMRQAQMKKQAIINYHREKENLKQTLKSMNINRQIELEEKRKNIMEKKIKSKINLKEKKEKCHEEKMKKYLQIKNEKKIRDLIVSEKNMKNEEYVREKVQKIKNEREKVRNINLTRRENIIFDETDYNFNETEREKERIQEEIYKLKNEENMRIRAIQKTKQNLMEDPYIRTIGLYSSKQKLRLNRSFMGNGKKKLGRVRSMKLNNSVEKRSFDFNNMYD